MSSRTLNLDNRLYQYLLDHSLRETESQTSLREQTRQMEWGRMQISPEQGQFMALLVELTGARNILEIGTFTGYSALCMAQALPPTGKVICCDSSEDWTHIAQTHWQAAGIRDRIDLRIAPAMDTLKQLILKGRSGQFDMAFIDADKVNYKHYFEACLTLLRPGGLMLLDNTLWGGAVADPLEQDMDTVALRMLNDALHKDERITLSQLPVGDGLTLARKR